MSESFEEVLLCSQNPCMYVIHIKILSFCVFCDYNFICLAFFNNLVILKNIINFVNFQYTLTLFNIIDIFHSDSCSLLNINPIKYIPPYIKCIAPIHSVQKIS
ncbi:hypothetical protein EDEG_02946 [Edhazardia aedis USNM 41457]|uniref:Uncharacterized protein n=1 Tax=Edhazardia aedis (strain USNM 41457) TaxID=1003232 RepID=J8ZSN1_EDHAE|nr:hypothetical protein EDEG_02946 [Edhazardia aedis USNM 41457]|eukprot:EJW02663.1 hypothetical protein EDEG_02946 [Edhazardia aedis USNM 41457]